MAKASRTRAAKRKTKPPVRRAQKRQKPRKIRKAGKTQKPPKQARQHVSRALEDAPPRADGFPEGINLSQLQEWLRCRYRWHLKNRRKIERRAIQPPLDLGSAVHAGIAAAVRLYAAHAKPGLTPKRLEHIRSALGAAINTWASAWEKAHGVTQNSPEEEQQAVDQVCASAYAIAWKAVQDMNLDRWETLWLKGEPMVEMELRCDFLPGIFFHGRPDWVVKDREKNLNVVLDYKVREQMKGPEHEEVDLQLPVYQYLLDRNGIPTTGSVKYQIRAQAPREPELTQKGSMSRQRIATTWEIYKACLVKHGLNPADYVEMEQKLDVEFFRADYIYRNQFTVASIWDNIILPLGKLFVASRVQVRNMHYLNCGGCWAREFCLAELRGEDTGFLLETAYVNTDDPRAKLVMRPEDFSFTED